MPLNRFLRALDLTGRKSATIAQTAAVAEGTVYLYYRNKQDLLAGVVGRFLDPANAGRRGGHHLEASAVTQLEQLGALPPQLNTATI